MKKNSFIQTQTNTNQFGPGRGNQVPKKKFLSEQRDSKETGRNPNREKKEMFNWVLISLVASLTKVNHAGGQSFRPTDTSYPRYKRISPALDPYETRKCVPIPQVSIFTNQYFTVVDPNNDFEILIRVNNGKI